MIKYVKGNLLDSPAQALVNTVNTVGVMGKGIALQFKEAFPENFRQYKVACDRKELHPGKLLIVKELATHGEKYVVNFPTKTHWRQNSKYEYVESGLQALVKAQNEYGWESIAIPPLGCGNGKLDWEKVKVLMEQYLSELDAEVTIYEPNEAIKQLLQNQDKNKDTKLTPARAMLLYALYQYEALGEEASLFVANKLAYFLQRMGEPLRLKFEAHHFGPYSVQVGHVLYALNGVFLNGLEQKNAKAFEPLQMNYGKFKEVDEYVKKELTQEQSNRLSGLLHLVEGFQSSLSLELLATVDYILDKKPGLDKEGVVKEVSRWSDRKKKMLKPEYVKIAFDHLENYRTQPFHSNGKALVPG
jgi:O-acetyl-ADP-ribose deacetylase (regulator of RNase III)/uncharacterized protein YwgA